MLDLTYVKINLTICGCAVDKNGKQRFNNTGHDFPYTQSWIPVEEKY